MFKMYLTTALRSFKRKPVYTFINLLGIVLAMASVICIFTWVRYRLNSDKFHQKYEDIYQVCAEVHWGNEPWIQSNIQAAVAPEMRKRYPEINKISRVNVLNEVVLKHEDRLFYENGIMMVDSSFFDIFTFPLKRGSIQSFFKNPYSVILTQEKADKYFPGMDAVGQIINLNNLEMTVAGIVDDYPSNSTFDFEILLPFEFLGILNKDPGIDNNWSYYYLYSYLTLKENVDEKSFFAKAATLYEGNTDVEEGTKAVIHPFKDMIFRPPWKNRISMGPLEYIYIISFIALIILVVACINFMNLSTALFTKRSKDVGIRKSIGAKRKTIIHQFYIESFLISFSGGLIAFFLVKGIWPFFNQLVDENMELKLFSSVNIALFLAITFITSLIAGSYPAIYLSSFKPAKVLKGGLVKMNGKNNARLFLVVFQFAVALFLIISTLFSIKQIKFMQNKDLGFEKEHVVYVPINDPDQYIHLKNRLLKNPHVKNVSSASWWGFNRNPNTYFYNFPGKDPDLDLLLTFQYVDFEYIETLEIPIIEGRTFSKDYPADQNRSFIINEASVEIFNLKDPIGMPFQFNGQSGTIIGIMKDAHFRSLAREIDPRILAITDEQYNSVFIKLNSVIETAGKNTIVSQLKSIRDTWQETVPDIPFDYKFVDDMYQDMYQSDARMNRLMSTFATLAILISCIGLFGLTIYSTEQKTKEIGVRKVNGAKISQLISLLLTEFVKYVIIAFVLILPISYFFVQRLFQSYSYQTEMSWWIYILAGMLVLFSALVTVGFQSWNAARRNPVEALRYE